MYQSLKDEKLLKFISQNALGEKLRLSADINVGRPLEAGGKRVPSGSPVSSRGGSNKGAPSQLASQIKGRGATGRSSVGAASVSCVSQGSAKRQKKR